jgi:hypothetical protein
MNLLMFIIEKVEKKTGTDLIDLAIDLSDYDMAIKVPIIQLTADLGDLKKGAKFVDAAIKKQTEKPHDK